MDCDVNGIKKLDVHAKTKFYSLKNDVLNFEICNVYVCYRRLTQTCLINAWGSNSKPLEKPEKVAFLSFMSQHSDF